MFRSRMGFELNTALFLQQAHADGCSFTRTATLGHQTLFLRYDAIRAHFPALDAVALDRERYADRLLREAFGAHEVTSFDASDFEGATVVHDMNRPIAAEWHGRFDAVIEMGSLEHIFNFPVAIENLMRITAVGGRLFIVTPANNHFGHGFYQFGTDLFYRLLCAANGFEIERAYAFEHRYFGPEMGACGPWHEARDPAVVGVRPIVIGENPMLLMIRARRIAVEAGVLTIPQQSDYSAMWKGHADSAPAPGPAPPPSGGLKAAARTFLQTRCSGLYHWITTARFRRLREGQRRTEHALGGSRCFRRTEMQGDSPVS
jgi:SAM-dependent methyltransferase